MTGPLSLPMWAELGRTFIVAKWQKTNITPGWSLDTFLMYINEQISAFSAWLFMHMPQDIRWFNIKGPTNTTLFTNVMLKKSNFAQLSFFSHVPHYESTSKMDKWCVDLPWLQNQNNPPLQHIGKQSYPKNLRHSSSDL
jgi:hypothetical protein